MSRPERRIAALEYLGALIGLFVLLPLAIVVGAVRRMFSRRR